MRYKEFNLGNPVTHADYVMHGFLLGDFDLAGAVRRCRDDMEKQDLLRRLLGCRAISKEEAAAAGVSRDIVKVYKSEKGTEGVVLWH